MESDKPIPMDEEDFAEAFDLADIPGLAALPRLATLITRTPWFMDIGRPLNEREVNVSEDYLIALGFPETFISQAQNWQEAADILENGDWNSEAWEAEEQLRMGLIAEAVSHSDEETVEVALTHISHIAAEYITPAAEAAANMFALEDEELIRAATGAAVQTCYNAALVLAADVEDPEYHCFAVKFRLYELGRWPLGVTGGTFHIF